MTLVQVNAAAEAGFHAAPGDRVCAVNGLGGSVPELLEALQLAKRRDHFSLTFKREVSVSRQAPDTMDFPAPAPPSARF